LTDVFERAAALLEVQDRLVVVFNTPAHNPTGHTMTLDDWSAALAFFKEQARDGKKRIVILVDIAYIDYAGPASVTRPFMRMFTDLPENLLVGVAYSMSKSYTMYGMRSGAFIGITSSRDIADEFARINAPSNRGVWSNGTRGAQRLLADVAADSALCGRIDSERLSYVGLMKARADLFLTEAAAVGLSVLPYHTGFFVTVPASDPKTAADTLKKFQIYALPLKKGIRFAICSIPTHKISGIAARVKQAIE
jgi:aromatic-amino-acid transaminase